MKEGTNGSARASHKANECGEERQALVYRLKQSIEENGHGHIARPRDEAQGDSKPAVKEQSGRSRQEGEQIKGTGHSGLAARRCLSPVFCHWFCHLRAFSRHRPRVSFIITSKKSRSEEHTSELQSPMYL